MRDSSGAAGEIETVFSPLGQLERILRFEKALARAQAQAGLIPQAAARAIEACDIGAVDIAAIMEETARTGTPVVPLLTQLSQQLPNEAAGYLHLGVTSQDAIDTALVLQMQDGLAILRAELSAVGDAAATLADDHRGSVMAGRTFLQHAVPITFGLKAARWLAAITRRLQALAALEPETLALQLGGAAGTLAALAPNGPDVARHLARDLGLPLPDLPWHAERDRVATVVTALGVTAGTLGKIAADIVLLAQSDVAEVSEGSAEAKGVSSAMPQKRNPIDSIEALAASHLAIAIVPGILASTIQEHERGVGGLQYESRAVPEIFQYTSRAARHLRSAVSGLEVNPSRMRANIDRAGGTIMAESLAEALARAMPRQTAKQLAGELSVKALQNGLLLADVARADTRVRSALDGGALEQALDPVAYLGENDAMIDRALDQWRRYRAGA